MALFVLLVCDVLHIRD